VEKCQAAGVIGCGGLGILSAGWGIACSVAVYALCRHGLTPCLQYEVQRSWCCGSHCSRNMVEPDGTYDKKGLYGF
jgi:hypothetical protein